MNQEEMYNQQVPNETERLVPRTSIVVSYDGTVATIFFRESNFEDIFGCKANISLYLSDLFGPNTSDEGITRINSSMQSGKFLFRNTLYQFVFYVHYIFVTTTKN